MKFCKALAAALPLALGGCWLALASNARIRALRAELSSLDTRGQEEGESFVRTLQGAYAERQLEVLSRKREAAVDLAAARRDRFLGFLLAISSGLAFAVVRAALQIAAEIEMDRAATGDRPRGEGARAGASPPRRASERPP